MLMERKKGTSCRIQLDLPMNTWTREWERDRKFSSFPRGLVRRNHRTLGTWRKQHSIRQPCQQQPKSVSALLTPFLFQPERAAVWFPGTWLGPSHPNVEPCEKRLTFQSKCVTRKKGDFQEHLATEPGAGRSPWPQGVTCRSDVNRWDQQSLRQALLLMELGLQITLKTH